MNDKMNIFIIGRTGFLYETVKKLAKKNKICGIITSKAAPEYNKNQSDFKRLAQKLKSPYLYTWKLSSNAIDMIKSSGAEIAISINWVSIINKKIINLFKHGILNAHFADLPKYKGNAVVNWAILNGESSIPLTIHYMTEELDSGDILMQKFINITDTTTVKDVYDYAYYEIPSMFSEVIDFIINKGSEPISQNLKNKESFRCYPRIPQDSKIDWNDSAEYIDRLVRASTHPYSGAYTFIKHDGILKKMYVWKTRVVKKETNDMGVNGHIIRNATKTGESWVFCGRGIIALQLVQFNDGTEFEPGKIFKSIRIRFGFDVEEEIINLQKHIGLIE